MFPDRIDKQSLFRPHPGRDPLPPFSVYRTRGSSSFFKTLLQNLQLAA